MSPIEIASPSLTADQLRQLFGKLDEDSMREMILAAKEIERRLVEDGPRNDDELWMWVKLNLGIEIPRVAVCKGHDPPFKFLADAYFNRYPAILAMGNRGGGKTFLVALLHWLNSEFKPAIESCTFGATEAQSLRCYAHLRNWIYDDDGNKRPEISSSIMRETNWKKVKKPMGSKVEVLAGTPDAVNGPHPQVAHGDEVELMREDTWNESQPINTPIPTPTGMRLMGDLELDDEVFGKDGRRTRVTKIFELGERAVFEVKLTDGRSTLCCDDHLWFVAGQAQRQRGIWKVMRLSDIRERGLKSKSAYKNFLPQAGPVEFEEIQQLVDPYTLGVVLGDGHIGRTSVEFRSVDPEIVENVNLRGGWQLVSQRDGDHEKHRLNGKNRHGLSPITAFGQIGLAGRRSEDKFIPDVYLTGSRPQRLDLLRGLMDTDGCAIEGSSVGQFATISEQLADDLRSLVFSLGGRAIKRAKQFSSSWSRGTLFTLDISFADETQMFLLSRKQQKVEQRQRTLDPSIRSIEPAGMARCRCIGVDNDDESYLTTDYIVTHNSRNMAVSKTLPDGTNYPSQEILTSTRKSLHGRMQTLIDGINEAVKLGMKPEYKLIIWCIFEIAAEVPDCQMADEKERKDRLTELGLDPCSKCECHKIMKGKWPDSHKPRLLKDICKGRLFRSRGYFPYADVTQKFQQNSPYTWEAQQECSKPETEFNYLKGFSEERHGIRGFEPIPANGKIFESIDWGGTNPHAVNLYQQLDFALEVLDFMENPLILPEGSLVCFDEIYEAEIGTDKLSRLVKAMEQEYINQFGEDWKIYARFADPQGKSQRLDFKEAGLPCTWKTTRDFDTQVEWLVRDWWENNLIFYVVDKVVMFPQEAMSWQRDPTTGKQVDQFNHCMSDLRYCTANIRTINRRERRGRSTPKARGRHRSATVVKDTRRAISGPIGIRERGQMEDWRRRLGGPAGPGF